MNGLDADPVRGVWRAHPGLGRAYTMVTALAAGLGVTLLTGGDKRAAADAFDTIRELGGTTAWAAVLIVGALVLVAAALAGPRWVQAALLFGALMHGLFCLWFFLAAWHTPTASYWGSLIFFVFALWHLSQASEYTSGR